MIKELIDFLKQFPEGFEFMPYEGEACGVTIYDKNGNEIGFFDITGRNTYSSYKKEE